MHIENLKGREQADQIEVVGVLTIHHPAALQFGYPASKKTYPRTLTGFDRDF
jgi:hypothetical protein